MKTNTKTLRKIACLLLVICFAVLSLASCAASTPNANDASGTHGSITWDYKKDTKTLTLTGAGAIDTVDKESDNAPWAGDVRLSAEKIVISEGVTSVGAYALWGFANATELSLPASLTEIGDYAFAYCGKLSTVVLPKTLTVLGNGAFEGCSAIGSVFIPETVSKVGDYAFAYCVSMKSAVVTAKEVGANAFMNCRSLEQLILVPELTADKIGADAFLGASKNFDSANKEGSTDGTTVVTIKHLWSDRTEAAPAETVSLDYGKAQAFIPKAELTVDGVTVNHLSQTVTGNGAPQSVEFIYQKPEAPAETEPAETAPEASETPEADEPKEKEPVKASTIIAIVIMVLVLAGIGVGAFLLIRSDKKAAKSNGTARKNGKK